MGKWHYERFQAPDPKAGTTFWKWQKIWDSNAHIKLKIKFFSATVLSVFHYVTESLRNRHSPPEQNQCFPDIMPTNHPNISKDDKLTYEHVYKLTNITSNKKSTKKLLLFSGSLHSKKQRWSYLTILPYVPTYGKRSRGRQETTYAVSERVA